MNLLSALDKLIKEHGSELILKDHLALFKDQVLILQSENSSLNDEVKNLKNEINVLKSKIEGYENKINSNSAKVTILEIELLKHIANGNHLVEDIENKLQMGTAVINYHLAELEQKSLVSSSDAPMLGTWWQLEHSGRQYLIDNGHIS